MAAFLSQDPVMIQEIKDGVDVHERVRIDPNLFNGGVDRVVAKAFNFRQIYADERTAAYAYFMDPAMPRLPKKTWEKTVGGFYQKYNRFSKWHYELYIGVVKNKGMYVCPHTGMKLCFAKVKKGDYNKAQIYNWPVQGLSGGVVLALNLVQLRRFITENKLSAKITNTVHDSIVIDAPKKEVDKLVQVWYKVFSGLDKSLSRLFGIDWNVPLSGELKVGNNWLEMEKI